MTVLIAIAGVEYLDILHDLVDCDITGLTAEQLTKLVFVLGYAMSKFIVTPG